MEECMVPQRRSSRLLSSFAERRIGCPMLRNKASWCRGLCKPVRGRGACGQIAPHAMKSRIQRAIARQNQERARRQQTG